MGYYFSDLLEQEEKMRPKHRCSPLISPVVPKSETGVMEMEQGNMQERATNSAWGRPGKSQRLRVTEAMA